MREWLLQLDGLLRGEATTEDKLGDGLLGVSARGLAIIVLILAMIYGLCMGCYSLLKDIPPDLQETIGTSDRILQLFATTFKVPALFFLTLLVTFPSLYVFNALVGSRLRLLNLLRLLIASLAVNVAVLASLGLIVAFFSLSTSSYPFIVLLNVAVFSVSGALGLMFLLQTLHRMTSVYAEAEDATAATETPGDEPARESESEVTLQPDDQHESPDEGNSSDVEAAPQSIDRPAWPAALDMPQGQVFARHTRIVFRCWLVLFSVVGAQMGWVLRPFIGTPEMEFTLFRARESNFFASVLGALWRLLSGGG